ncbi:hypothetical protein LINGRAHAP2_LOCUS22638 [Linum grandiflorum]
MGRSFYRCPYWQDKRVDCQFFQWADEKTGVEEGIHGTHVAKLLQQIAYKTECLRFRIRKYT